MPGSRTPVESLGELGDRTIRKVKRRVLPLVVFLYFIAFLDRNNVGFAKLTMSGDIGLSASAYGLGAQVMSPLTRRRRPSRPEPLTLGLPRDSGSPGRPTSTVFSTSPRLKGMGAVAPSACPVNLRSRIPPKSL